MSAAIVASISDATIENQIPFMPKIKGKIIIHTIWKTSVRINEIAADTKPLLSAVKKDEPKNEIPQNKNENENIVNALIVIFTSYSS